MYVRLAFAVQACVEPEILIVDEALAVGDIGFQYKCYKRMEALRAKGVTIIMVTHSTGSILEYADRCPVMEHGKLIGDTNDVLAAVLAYEKGMIPPTINQSLQNLQRTALLKLAVWKTSKAFSYILLMKKLGKNVLVLRVLLLKPYHLQIRWYDFDRETTHQIR